METELVETKYPIICNENYQKYKLVQVSNQHDDLFNRKNEITDEDYEIQYLKELSKFQQDEFERTQKKINGRIRMIENVRKFDISKVSLLPDDMINEIKSYIQPELEYTRKFSIIRYKLSYQLNWWLELDKYLFDIPKSVLMDMCKKADIYLCKWGVAGEPWLKSNDKKDEWVRSIYQSTEKQFSFQKSNQPICKLMDKKVYGTKHEDRLFKLYLLFKAFLSYKNELKQDTKNKKDTIKKLNKTKVK